MTSAASAAEVTGRRGTPVERALVAAARALSSQLELEGALNATITAVHDVFEASAAWIMLCDPASKTLKTVMVRGLDTYRDIRVPLADRSMSAHAFRSREVVFVPDVTAETRWFDAGQMHASGLRSLLILPLIWGAETLGVVALDAPRFSADHPPDSHDVELLEALAAQAAVAIKNAQLFEAGERDRERLRELLRHQRQLSGRIDRLEREVRDASGGGEFVGESEAVRELMRQVTLVARGDTTVLLLGETGTGKDLLARLIHEHSRRAAGPFVPVNCAALPDTLVESELFGHEKGAFTGALARKPGSFEAASGGTIFLDEVGDLPLEAQAKLLRVLQERQVQRLGSARPITVNARVIAATNHDLEQAVLRRHFRPDLYYRLSVFPIGVPALRDRPSDIPMLAERFLAHFARRLGKDVASMAPAALRRLVGYPWPGNIRELQNVIERAVILSQGPVIDADGLFLPAPPVARALSAIERADPAVPLDPLSRDTAPPATVSFADAERQAIRAALHLTGWRISGPGGAAARLGLKPTTLHAKMKKLGIRRPSAAGASSRTTEPSAV